MTAVLLFSKDRHLDKNEVDLCAIGIINSLISITAIWQMTSFLLSISIKSFENRRGGKWTLVCLMCNRMGCNDSRSEDEDAAY